MTIRHMTNPHSKQIDLALRTHHKVTQISGELLMNPPDYNRFPSAIT